MTNPAKTKGDKAELEAARIIANLTGYPARRKLGAGRTDDTGDIAGVPDTTLQVKSYHDFLRGIREGLNDLNTQQANAGTTHAAVLARKTGGTWVAILPLDGFCTLLREALTP